MAKINWAEALLKYISTPSVSYNDIAKEFGVEKSTVARRAKKEVWPRLRTEMLSKSLQYATDILAKKIADAKARQEEYGRMLQSQALTAIKNKELTPKTFSEAKEALKDGVVLEDKALGIDKETPQQSMAIQINFTANNLTDKSLLNTCDRWSK